jgi:hypothetical protein
MAHFKFGFVMRHLFHVRQFGNLLEFFHPIRNGLAILLFD